MPLFDAYFKNLEKDQEYLVFLVLIQTQLNAYYHRPPRWRQIIKAADMTCDIKIANLKTQMEDAKVMNQHGGGL